MTRRALARALVVAAVLGPLTGCGGGGASTTAAPSTASTTPAPSTATSSAATSATADARLRVERSAVDGQASVVVSDPGAVVRGLVVFLHGTDQLSGALVDDAKLAPCVEALARAGYVVAASDAGGDAFGSPASQDEYADLLASVRLDHPADDVFLLAESMGGLAALPLAASGRLAGLRGVAGISPATTFDSPGIEPYASTVASSWGGAFPTPEQDPLSLPPERFAGLAFRFYVADEDEEVPTAQHAERFAARVAGAAQVTWATCTGGHVAPGCFQPDDLVAWVEGLSTDR